MVLPDVMDPTTSRHWANSLGHPEQGINWVDWFFVAALLMLMVCVRWFLTGKRHNKEVHLVHGNSVVSRSRSPVPRYSCTQGTTPLAVAEGDFDLEVPLGLPQGSSLSPLLAQLTRVAHMDSSPGPDGLPFHMFTQQGTAQEEEELEDACPHLSEIDVEGLHGDPFFFFGDVDSLASSSEASLYSNGFEEQANAEYEAAIPALVPIGDDSDDGASTGSVYTHICSDTLSVIDV